jgi:type II secretory pathway pseudopilin PulG
LKQQCAAFTRLELLVVILVVLMLFSMFPVSFPNAKQKAQRITCISNFKVLGTAYRLWAGDNGDLVPAQQTLKNGGWGDFLTNADQGPICWTNYAILREELGQYAKTLICPADERTAAKSFATNFDNLHVSYFVGVSADSTYPQSIQGGDRNLGPGPKLDPDYGYSPKSGKGNDVAIPISGPVLWSLKMHSDGNMAGAGNILLGDGSGQQVSSASFNQNWLHTAPPTTNWPAGHSPATPSIRLVFP